MMSDDDVERQPLLQGNSVNVNQNGSISANSTSTPSNTATTVSPIGPDELPPPYSSVAGGVQMVSCRVCSNMIDISGKKDQVRARWWRWWRLSDDNLVVSARCEVQPLQRGHAHQERSTRQEVREVSLQLSPHL